MESVIRRRLRVGMLIVAILFMVLSFVLSVGSFRSTKLAGEGLACFEMCSDYCAESVKMEGKDLDEGGLKVLSWTAFEGSCRCLCSNNVSVLVK